MLKLAWFERLCSLFVEGMDLLFQFMYHERLFNLEQVIKQCSVLFTEALFVLMDFIQVGNDVFKVVDQVEAEEFLEKGWLDFREHVDIALLTVPCFELVFS